MAAKKNKANPVIPPQKTEKNTSPTPSTVVEKEKKEDLPLLLSQTQLLVLTGGLGLLYFLFSFVSDGFYQQDEAAHYLNMLRFWNEPHSVLSNWAKPGFKLIYAVPALLGETFVHILNCVFSAASCYIAYRLAEHYGSRQPLLAFVLLAFQPFWIMLSFRNYSELIAAFLLISGVYLHEKEKYPWAALVLSYICFIRQEFYPMLALYFALLVWKRQFVAAVLTGVFPLVHNFWGAAHNGDIFYLFNSVLRSSEQIGSAYPRKGFDHYFMMSVTVFGGMTLTLFLSYLGLKAMQKEQPRWLLLVPAAGIFLMYCIFNIQSVEIGPSTAGNLRYLLFIAPLVAVMASLATEEIRKTTDGWKVLYLVLPFALIVAIFMTYEHNFVVFTKVRDFKPLLGVLIAGFLLILPLSLKQQAQAFAGAALFLVLLTVRPVKMSEEDKSCRSLARWYESFEKQNGERQLVLSHSMFYYFLDRDATTFKYLPMPVSSVNVEKAPVGSIIVWDSHYSYRPELNKDAVDYSYFTEKPERFREIYQIRAVDNTFGALVFEKIK